MGGHGQVAGMLPDMNEHHATYAVAYEDKAINSMEDAEQTTASQPDWALVFMAQAQVYATLALARAVQVK
jgi:hypothetical protein